LVVNNPATGQEIARVQSSTPREVSRSIEKARKAFLSWRETDTEARIDLFGKLAELIQGSSDELVELMGDETGKRKSDAEYEVFDILDGITHYSRQLRLMTYSDHVVPLTYLPHGTKYNTIPEMILQPHGVVGVIMPWNFPFWIPMASIIPAVLAGNTVVFKSPLIGEKIVSLFKSAKFPTGVVELVQGGDEVGKALVGGGIDLLFFTGSAEVGREVIKSAGVIPVEAEMGGNSASIVCEDANLDLAADGTVWGALYNAGQSCSGHKRVFVHEKVADEFTQKVLTRVKSLQPIRDYGPYISKEAMNGVNERVQDAIQRGARLLEGGTLVKDIPEKYRNGNWYLPTVIELSTDDVDLVAKETFGNILPIRVVKDEQEAISLANNTSYGLTNVLWSKDLDRAKLLAAQLESGMVFINEAELALVAGEYWGGWKNSGVGRVGSKMDKCFKPKLLITYTGQEPREYWFPYE